MSFADLRTTRQKKEFQSYVRPDVAKKALPTDTTTPSSVKNSVSVEGLYHSLPTTTDVRPSTISGRGLWAKERFEPGKVLIALKPHIAVLSNQYLDSYCSSCFGPASESGLKRCTQCQTTWYCDSACQNRDWVFHKHECNLLRKWSESAPSPEHAIPSDAIRCLGRVLWKRKKEGSGSVWAREIDMMQSHRTSVQPSAFELHTFLAHSITRYLNLSSPAELAEFGFSSAGDLVDIISRFITNSFTISTPSLTPIGVSVSPPIALINHSCDPNAVIVFPRSTSTLSTQEPLLQVVVLRPIAPDEEISTSYIDSTVTRTVRQKSLQETYNFMCNCQVCVNALDVDPRESMWCPKSCGGTCSIPTEENRCARCTECKAVVQNPDAVLDALRLGQDALDKATALQVTDPAKARQLTTNLIQILTSAGLTPSSHPLLALSRLQQSLLLSSLPVPLTQEVLDEAVRAAVRSVQGLSAVLREGHPVRGVALAELGKILAVDEPAPKQFTSAAEAASVFPPSGPARLNLAYETLLKARNELLIGFGTVNGGGQVGSEVRELILSLEKELATWKQGIRNVLEDTPSH